MNFAGARPPYAIGTDAAARRENRRLGNFTHDFLLPGSNKIIGSIGTELVGGHYMDNSNSSGFYQPTYTRTTIDATYEDGGGHWSVSAFVRNLENNGVIMTWGVGAIGTTDTAQVYPPRTFGLSVRWHLL